MAGAIPLIRPLRESLAGERIRRVVGIVNGTTNFILTMMSEQGLSYSAALEEAQRLGFAERDPTADVDGHDAAAKAAILASLAFRCVVVGTDVPRQGIASVDPVDIAFADRLGYVVKLLAVAERFDDGADAERPTRDLGPGPSGHAAAHPSAGGGPGCLQRRLHRRGGRRRAHALRPRRRRAARRRRPSSAISSMPPTISGPVPPLGWRPGCAVRIRPDDDLWCAWYLSIDVADRPGVLAAVAQVFGDHGVSIRSMEQVGLGDEARLIFLTHVARAGDVRRTIDGLRSSTPSIASAGSSASSATRMTAS